MLHRKNVRAQWYDYASPGTYFVTICTKDRQHYFGEIVGSNMKLSDLGKFCSDEIVDTSRLRSYVSIHEYVVMPNHVHIVMDVGMHGNASNNNLVDKDMLPHVPTITLGSIIRNIKLRVTKYANDHQIPFAWQGRYHDHIIRNEKSYQQIVHYVQTNVQNWKDDTFYS